MKKLIGKRSGSSCPTRFYREKINLKIIGEYFDYSKNEITFTKNML
jgi:hypothetical protein